MRKSDILFGLSALVCFQAWVLGADVAAPKSYLVHIKLTQLQANGNEQDGVQKVLATPTVIVLAGYSANIDLGDKVSVGDDRFMRYGTQMKFRINPTDEGKIRITGKCEVSALLVDSSPAKHVGKRGTTIYLDEVVELEKMSSITLGDQSLEFTVDEFVRDLSQPASTAACHAEEACHDTVARREKAARR